MQTRRRPSDHRTVTDPGAGLNSSSHLRSTLIAAVRVAAVLGAICSVAVSIAGGLGRGIDIGYFQEFGRNFLAGNIEGNPEAFCGYPPFSVAAFAPLALIPFDLLRVMWLALNLGAAGLCLHLVFRLWGENLNSGHRLALAAFFLSLAPFRVTLRNGQLSLLVLALILGAVFLLGKGKKGQAGLLVGLSLVKYSLGLPFLLYWLWRREWKASLYALVVPLLLTAVYLVRFQASPFDVAASYFSRMNSIVSSNVYIFTGTTEIKPLFELLDPDNARLAALLTWASIATALVLMALAFRRGRGNEIAHYSIVSLFMLWFVYHRTYDSVFILIPAALSLNEWAGAKRKVLWTGMLALQALFVVSIPGLLTERLGLPEERLSASLPGLIGLHIERLLVLGMFAVLLVVLMKGGLRGNEEPPV